MADVDALNADIGFDVGEIAEGATDELALLADLGYTFELAAVPGGGAPAVFTIDLAGDFSCSGTTLKQIAKDLAGALSPTSGQPLKTSSKQYAGTTTPSGALLKTPAKIFRATLTPSATTTEFAQHQRSFSGAISPTGTDLNLRSALRSFTGSMSYSGNVLKFPSKFWAGATTPTGTLSAVATHARSTQATATSIGTLSNLIQKPLGGSLTASGDLQKISSKVLSGTISPTSSVFRFTIKSFSGTSTPFGTVQTFVARLQSFGGTLTAISTLSFVVEKIHDGTFTPTGVFAKGVDKTWRGDFTPAGDLTKEIPKAFAGAAISAGALTMATTRTFTITLSGQIAPSGNVDLVFVEAPIFVVDERTPGFRKSRRPATVTAVPLTYVRPFAGSVSFAGRLELLAAKSLVSVVDVSTRTADDIVSIRVVPRVPSLPELPRLVTLQTRGAWTSRGELHVERVLFVDPDELIFDGGLFNV